MVAVRLCGLCVVFVVVWCVCVCVCCVSGRVVCVWLVSAVDNEN